MRANTLQDYNDGLEKAKILEVLRESGHMANGSAEKAVSRAITDAFQTWQEETKV